MVVILPYRLFLTYKGLLGFQTYKGNLNLDLIQGTMAFYVPQEQVTELVFGLRGFSASMTLEEAIQFYREAGEEAVGLVDRQTIFVVYAGEVEKFQAALDLVAQVSGSLKILGKEKQAKFFLLTCNCDLAKKARESEALHSGGRLECVVYNPAGACGGFEDLQAIAETVLNAVPEK